MVGLPGRLRCRATTNRFGSSGMNQVCGFICPRKNPAATPSYLRSLALWALATEPEPFTGGTVRQKPGGFRERELLRAGARRAPLHGPRFRMNIGLVGPAVLQFHDVFYDVFGQRLEVVFGREEFLEIPRGGSWPQRWREPRGSCGQSACRTPSNS